MHTQPLKGSARRLAMTALLSAVAVILMLLEFPLPFLIPDFIKMDFSDLPALIAAFSMGPWQGVVVCLIKNLIHMPLSGFMTRGVGELSNFLLGASFVLLAGAVYRRSKTRGAALVGSLCGAVLMALISIPINLFLTYPIYYSLMPKEVILGFYQALLPFVDSIFTSLCLFNAPFTLLKGLLVTLLTFLIYKRISSFIQGT